MYFNNLLLVFLDNSQDNCIGSIKKNALKQNWTEYVNITDSYLCLKICMQKHERYSWVWYSHDNKIASLDLIDHIVHMHHEIEMYYAWTWFW